MNNDGKMIGPPPGDRLRTASAEPARAHKSTPGWEAYSNWLNRVQGGTNAGGGRHAAITRNLNSWNHYKTWADKVRNSWDREK